MTKVTSRLMTLLLSFAMVFTSIAWLGAANVNAATDDSILYVQVKDGDEPVSGVKLVLEYQGNDDLDDLEFDSVTNENGVASYEVDNSSEGIFKGDFYYIAIKDNTEYTYDDVKVIFGADGSDSIIESVGGEPYAATEESPFTFAVSKSAQTRIDYVNMADADWKALGISASDISRSDILVDVRPVATYENGYLAGSVNVPVSNPYTEEQQDAIVKFYDENNAKGRIVIVCVSGNKLAKNAMQALYDEGKDLSNVTYLIGGANGVSDKWITADNDYVKMDKTSWEALGIKASDINRSDILVDVRPAATFEKGYLSGSVNVPVSNPYTEEQQTAIASFYDDNSAKGRIVIVCVSGNMLAKNAMAALRDAGKDLSNVTYLIGGANGVSDKWVTAETDYVNMDKDAWEKLGITSDNISDNDILVDVRPANTYKAGRLAGSVNVPVSNPYTEEQQEAIASFYDDNSAKGRIVIVCVSGNMLAKNAMAALRDAGKDLSNVTYLIGGANGVSDRWVVDEDQQTEDPTPAPVDTPASDKNQTVKDGQTATVSAGTVKVLSAKSKTVAFTKAKNKKSVTVPATVKVNGQMLKVTQVGAKAFTGKKIRTVTIGANVTKISKNAFKGSKATKIIIKSKKLKKASVKGSLAGSKVKTVQVKVGNTKANKTYVKTYKKIFTKKNAGKKVTVK